MGERARIVDCRDLLLGASLRCANLEEPRSDEHDVARNALLFSEGGIDGDLPGLGHPTDRPSRYRPTLLRNRRYRAHYCLVGRGDSRILEDTIDP